MPGSVQQFFHLLLQDEKTLSYFFFLRETRKFIFEIIYLKLELLISSDEILAVALAINKLHDEVESFLDEFAYLFHASSEFVEVTGVDSSLDASDLLDELADGVGGLGRLGLDGLNRLFHAHLNLLDLVHLRLQVPDYLRARQVLAQGHLVRKPLVRVLQFPDFFI